MKKTATMGLTILLMIALLAGCGREKFCRTHSIALNKVCPYYDGQWQGITTASDGACYFSSSSHTLIHGGGFFRFDPETRQFDVLIEDFNEVTGDDLSKHTPQGKCHSPVIEIDGTLYLSTHVATYWDEVIDMYPGSYVYSYNIHSKEWRNYGIVKPQYTTYTAIEVDPGRGKIYAMIVPARRFSFALEDKTFGSNHLFEIDMETAEKRDLGRLSTGRSCFWFYLDHKGRVWASLWQGMDKLHCYDPETDTIITYDDPFPEPRLAPDGKPVEKASYQGKAWTWAQAIDDRRKCLFTMGDKGEGDERLWIFDPEKDIFSGEAFTPVCYIGSTFLSVALGGNRVYYIQRGKYETERNYSTEHTRDLPPDKKGYHVNNLHLRSVSLDPEYGYQITDHGRIIDQGGRTPCYIGSIAADEKGNVFINGGWLVKPGDQPTLEYRHEKGEYDTLSRGEFFAWVNVTEDLR
jgi:hypothetical protein